MTNCSWFLLKPFKIWSHKIAKHPQCTDDNWAIFSVCVALFPSQVLKLKGLASFHRENGVGLWPITIWLSTSIYIHDIWNLNVLCFMFVSKENDFPSRQVPVHSWLKMKQCSWFKLSNNTEAVLKGVLLKW